MTHLTGWTGISCWFNARLVMRQFWWARWVQFCQKFVCTHHNFVHIVIIACINNFAPRMSGRAYKMLLSRDRILPLLSFDIQFPKCQYLDSVHVKLFWWLHRTHEWLQDGFTWSQEVQLYHIYGRGSIGTCKGPPKQCWTHSNKIQFIIHIPLQLF